MSYQPHGQQFGHVDPEERLDYAEAEPPEEEYEPRRRLPMIALAAGAAALFIGGLWFAYHEGAKHAGVSVASGSSGNAADNVPLIRADTEPVKVKPDKAGGMSIPDKDDPLYTMGRGGNAEHILPPPEAPQPRPVAPPPPPQPTAQAPASIPPAGAYPPPLPAPPPVSVQAKHAPKPAEAAKPAKSAAPAAGGPPVKVQLASLRTPDEAREEWQRLKHENADLLGRLTAVAVKADLGERGIWYRVEAGPVGDRAAAIKLCRALKERDLGCQLVQ
ncbi:MAG TPA: SPOR domain-containing protein [Stellaceae bacterium]|nr:SPOR domain-containing protein [Stellaceae bacterium]